MMRIISGNEYIKDINGNIGIEKAKNLANKTLNSKKQQEDDKLKEVCSEFEAIFLNQIFKQMRNSVKSLNSQPLIDGGFAEEVFKDMLYEEYSKTAAKFNSIGIADIVYNYLKGR